ncbi:TetR/AcrR family transcriptional regulator [Falsirhodobacter deserti]|uniref:TetR/AcrR family transcriptional regulator n=1 Tax=Falsirhodobacter deserti TaxID=1365611 RepID=UPI000FE42234|nr:TetR/AcrR family transcriptional regulator [Falsirhodobacter deserti]
MPQPLVTPSRSAETRARLRRAAIDVFATKGYHQTKISDIVAAAGVSQPTFYIYFATKEAAFETLIEEFRTSLHAATEQCLISPDIPPDGLLDDVRKSFVRFLTVLTADPALTRIGFLQSPEGDVTRAQMIEWSIRNMEQEQKDGILRSDVPVAYQARLVLGLLEQVATMEDDLTLEERAEICASLFCRALSARAG